MTADNFMRRRGLDGSRRDLADEFRRQPFGLHSCELRCLLNFMRSGPAPGKYFLVNTIPLKEWVLARMSPSENSEPEIYAGTKFDSPEKGEWHVFKLRWREIFGRPVPDEADIAP